MARLQRAGHGQGGTVVGVHAQEHAVELARVLRRGHQVVYHLADHGVLVPGGYDHGQHLGRLLVDARKRNLLAAHAAEQGEHVP